MVEAVKTQARGSRRSPLIFFLNQTYFKIKKEIENDEKGNPNRDQGFFA